MKRSEMIDRLDNMFINYDINWEMVLDFIEEAGMRTPIWYLDDPTEANPNKVIKIDCRWEPENE